MSGCQEVQSDCHSFFIVAGHGVEETQEHLRVYISSQRSLGVAGSCWDGARHEPALLGKRPVGTPAAGQVQSQMPRDHAVWEVQRAGFRVGAAQRESDAGSKVRSC